MRPFLFFHLWQYHENESLFYQSLVPSGTWDFFDFRRPPPPLVLKFSQMKLEIFPKLQIWISQHVQNKVRAEMWQVATGIHNLNIGLKARGNHKTQKAIYTKIILRLSLATLRVLRSFHSYKWQFTASLIWWVYPVT